MTPPAGAVPGDVDADLHHQLGPYQGHTQRLVRAPPGGKRPACLLGRYDAAGRLRYTGRTTTLAQAAGRALAASTQISARNPSHAAYAGADMSNGGEEVVRCAQRRVARWNARGDRFAC